MQNILCKIEQTISKTNKCFIQFLIRDKNFMILIDFSLSRVMIRAW